MHTSTWLYYHEREFECKWAFLSVDIAIYFDLQTQLGIFKLHYTFPNELLTKVVKKCKRTWAWKLHLCIFIILDDSKLSLFQPQLVERRKQKNLCERMAADLAKWWAQNYAKDCLFTSQEQACTLITWLFVCSFDWLSLCWEWPNTQENGCWLTHIDHIQSESLCQTRQNQERGKLD